MTAMETGRIIKALSGFYYCRTEEGTYQCRGKGAFRKESVTPLVGDWVRFEAGEGEPDESGFLPGGFVTEILQRKNQFVRPPVANLDQLCLVSAVAEPAPSPLLLDKLIAVCEYKQVEPLLVFTKTDLGSPEELRRIYTAAGFRVFCLTDRGAEDLEPLRACLRGRITAFAGNTGVGKSSLLNRLEPNLSLQTAGISRKLGRGKHTTRHVELYPVLGGYVADTPGFGSMELLQYERIRKEELQHCFREFAPYLADCRFTGCSHTVEKGCAVLEALEKALISPTRHESYRALYEDSKQLKDWE